MGGGSAAARRAAEREAADRRVAVGATKRQPLSGSDWRELCGAIDRRDTARFGVVRLSTLQVV